MGESQIAPYFLYKCTTISTMKQWLLRPTQCTPFPERRYLGLVLGFGCVKGGTPQCRWDPGHVTSNCVTCGSKLKVKTIHAYKHCSEVVWRFSWGLESFFRRFDPKPRRLSSTFADFKMLCNALQPEVVDARVGQGMAACGSLAPMLMTWALGIWTEMTQVDQTPAGFS